MSKEEAIAAKQRRIRRLAARNGCRLIKLRLKGNHRNPSYILTDVYFGKVWLCNSISNRKPDITLDDVEEYLTGGT